MNLTYQELEKLSSRNVDFIVSNDSFDNILKISKQLLNNEKWEPSLQEFAVKVLERLKVLNPVKWNSDWRYEAFLGHAYNIICDYDRKYLTYKNALAKVNPPPPELLVALARCYLSPEPPITFDESFTLVKKSIENNLYIEAVELICGLYKLQNDEKEEKKYRDILKKTKTQNFHLMPLDEFITFDP